MKKTIIVLGITGVILTVIGGLIIIFSNVKNQPYVGEFSLAEYQWEIETFSLDKNVGQVDDKNVAIEKAKSLWLEKYGIDNGQQYNFISGRKIEVSYDFKEECWHIYGTLQPNTLGGVPHSIIRKSGEVLAVWIDD